MAKIEGCCRTTYKLSRSRICTFYILTWRYSRHMPLHNENQPNNQKSKITSVDISGLYKYWMLFHVWSSLGSAPLSDIFYVECMGKIHVTYQLIRVTDSVTSQPRTSKDSIRFVRIQSDFLLFIHSFIHSRCHSDIHILPCSSSLYCYCCCYCFYYTVFRCSYCDFDSDFYRIYI